MQTRRSAFALPTVLLASTAMLIVLAAALAATTSIGSLITQQYYQRLGLEAAEAGAIRAQDCLMANGYISSWPTNSLYPNTSCSGGAACTNSASCYVFKSAKVSTSFQVLPLAAGADITKVQAIGNVTLYRQDGSVQVSYPYQSNARMSNVVGAQQITLGYNGGGAFFGTIGADRVVRMVGLNTSGQLGNGTIVNSLTPTTYTVPSSSQVVSLYSNFVSLGYQMFAQTADGSLYGSGWNQYGQIGNGIIGSPNQLTPSQFILPNGVGAQYVAPDGYMTYVLGTDNNLYAAGYCSYGVLGYNYTISGCANQSTPQKVALPAGEVPTTSITTDRLTVYVITTDGKVWGWGIGDVGQLGLISGGYYSYGSSSVPVQIGTFGNSGQPKATQIAFDGDGLYILDSTGSVSSIGSNSFGQAGNPQGNFINPNSGKCIDNANADGTTIRLWPCNETGAQHFQMQPNSDGTITLYNSQKNVCMDDQSGAGSTLWLYPCNGTNAQRWTNNSRSQWVSKASGNCFDNANADGTTMRLYSCNGTPAQAYFFGNSTVVPFNRPAAMTGTVTKIWTDQWSVSCLTSTGQVWTSGANINGQFGNGTATNFNPTAGQFQLPAGVTATDIYETAVGAAPTLQNLYVIGSDGKVYGAGSNSYGQLGNGTTAATQITPVAMNVIDGVNLRATAVKSGNGTTVIFVNGSRVYAVGNNNSGQLGDGTTNNSSTPAANTYLNATPTTLY